MTMTRVVDPEDIRARWKWFVALGAIMLVLGLVILWNVVDATLVTTILIGFMLVAAGVAEVVAAFGTGRSLPSRLLHLLLGALYVIVGFNLALDPLSGAITLTVVIAALLVADGIIRLVEALAYRPRHWGLVLLIAVVNVLLGLWLWTGIPYSGVAIGFFVGIEILMAGVLWIAVGFTARDLGDEPEGMRSRPA